MTEQNDTDTQDRSPGFWRIVLSTLAAAMGVQSDKNRQRDFRHGNLYAYIAAGLIFTATFVGGLILLVQYLINTA